MVSLIGMVTENELCAIRAGCLSHFKFIYSTDRM